MKLRIVSLAIAGAVAGGLLVMPDIANARMGNSSFAGSKGVSSRPAPTPPRTTERPQLVHSKLKLLRCYHTREQNQYGVYVHRTHCG